MKKNRSNRFNRFAAIAAITGVQFASLHAAALSDEDAQTLIRRVNELEQEVKVLKRNREVDQEIASAKSKDLPVVSLGAKGLTVRSADTNFVMNIHGYVQADTRNFFGQKTTPDNFILRRVRPIVEGSIWKDFNYRVMLDLAGGTFGGANSPNPNNVSILDDAYVNATIWQQFQVQVGKYKAPVGLERLQSTSDIRSIETGYATQLTPNYDLGLTVHNDYFNTPVGYSIGVFTGAADGANQDFDVDQGKDVVGRIFAQPFLNSDKVALKHLGFGVGGSVGNHTLGALSSYKTPGQQTFFSYNSANVAPGGQLYRIDPQFYYYVGPFGLMGEYILSSQTLKTVGVAGAPPTLRMDNTAWQVQASYVLTGEENSFKGIVPLHRLSRTDGGWGAFELVARIQQISLDSGAFRSYGGKTAATAGSAQKATSWGVGVNWYLNANVKLNLNYESTTYSGGTALAGATTSAPEHAILSQVQFAF